MEVKGCSKRNRWHFCENTVVTVWNWVIPALRCLDITCLCILSFRLKDFRRQTRTNSCHANSSGAECRLRKPGKMLRFYIGFQVIKFYCFPPPPPPRPPSPHHHISIVLPPPPPPHFYCFLFFFFSSLPRILFMTHLLNFTPHFYSPKKLLILLAHQNS